MSSRTKGFFEQDHRPKPKQPHWNRNDRSKVPLNDTTNIPPPKPPVPATSQAKAKLKAFQFVAGRPESDTPGVTDQENVVEGGLEIMRKDVQKGSSSAPQQAAKPSEPSDTTTVESTTALQLPHANTFPSTPGAHLSLEDLIGNVDEIVRFEPREESPEEHIGWIPNSSSKLLTPSRKRKRARSSSPSCPNTSSQRIEAPANSAGGSEKRTPDADPAADLWQRYGIGKNDGDTSKLPNLSHMALQGSPKPLETPIKSAGLRRWASTGNDWPASRSKKRRANDTAKVNLWQDEQVQLTSRSKVAAMVEKMQESLATQKLAKAKPAAAVQAEPSSSSPFPDNGGGLAATLQDASPLGPKQHKGLMKPPPRKEAAPQRNSASIRSTFQKEDRQADVQPADPVLDCPHTMGGNSVQQDAINSAPLHLRSKAPLPAFKRPSMSRTPSIPAIQPPPPPAFKALPVMAEDLDEFADGMDFSAEDLDELMSQAPLEKRTLYDIPPHPNPPPQQQADLTVQESTTANANCVEDDEDEYGEDALEDDLPTHSNPSLQPQHPAIQHDTPVASNKQGVIIDDDDEFGGDDLDEDTFAEVELQATQAHRSPRKGPIRKSRSPRKRQIMSQAASSSKSADGITSQKHYRRFTVIQVIEGEFTNDKGRRSQEKVLMGEEDRTRHAVAITLRGTWVATSLSKGNVIHVSSLPGTAAALRSESASQIELNDSATSPFLIVHPDHMLSATTVADSFDCVRKAVLQDRIKATGETSKAMIYGSILHEIFQQALSANRWDDTFLSELVQRTVQTHVEGLWELGMQDGVLAVEEIRAKMGELAAWAKTFVVGEPSDISTVDDRQGSKLWMSISKLIAIEEHVWSPQYGLKGNIDATIEATIRDDPRQPAKKLVTPFEVKTGRTTQSPAHRAQTALYTLLLSDRYDVNVEAGILYYLESSSMTRIAPPTNEIRQMIQQRNRLATYISRAKFPPKPDASEPPMPTQDTEKSGLPALLKNPFKCGKCYAQQSCFTYHALTEEGSGETAGMVDDGKKNHALVWQEAVGHLLKNTGQEKAYAQALRTWFSKWDKLLTFEESEMSRFRKELWTMFSSEREEAGRCFGNLVIAQDLASTAAAVSSTLVDGIGGSGGKINRFVYAFCRSNGNTPGLSFAEGSQLTVGEPIVVSSERGQWALANGYVVAVSKHKITVAVDRRLGDARQRHRDFDHERNQHFKGIMNVDKRSADAEVDTAPVLYRVDKDEFSNGLALVRNNLVTLMSSHPMHTKLRNQIVFDPTPTFSGASRLPTMAASQLGNMNDDQQAAVSKVLTAQDYALILGMPGTGKTTTIAHVIRALLAENKSILLTSYTHTAVDNILMKIKDVAPKGSVLRLGVPAKINPQVQAFCQLAATPRESIEEIEEAYMGCRIVATTCMGTNHALFQRRAFDVCIVDEASQITLPIALGPLLHARKFVLVGDHYQLPPLVQNRSALEGGLDVSLFRQLSERFPQAVATLGRQYRMCEDIMVLSNTLIYSGKLKCGNAAVANRTLQLSHPDGLAALHSNSNAQVVCPDGPSCWLDRLKTPRSKVMFANIDPLGSSALETLSSGKNITNMAEVTLTAQLVVSLLALGVPAKEVGVITLYRSQLSLLRQTFKSAGIESDVEIDSADRFQGRDKECVILSMVRSNQAGIVGELLKDWRRVNVALTRARSKLIVLGSRTTLSNNDLLKKFLALVDENGWAMDLPKGADEMHTLPTMTQTSAVPAVASSTERPAIRSPHTKNTRDRILLESSSAANRSPIRKEARKPGKVVQGKSTLRSKHLKLREQIAVEIFEDLTGNEF